MPIHILPPDIINKIAAGEVIERPASVAKELIENAIDAGATEIEVAVDEGGQRLIQVSDNGSGIAADQVEVAFARHATSKLESADDLYRIRTLGFRGEALASIAAVSQLTLTTRTQEDSAGTLVRYHGGERMEKSLVGRSLGTSVMVEHLFFNTPARKKFLRSDSTEASHVARLVSSYALAFPTIRFTLKKNGRQILASNGTGKLLDAIVAVYGLDTASQMVELEPQENPELLLVSGYTGEPGLNRSNRGDIVLFVNHRWIQDNTLSYAITEAYRGLLPQRRYPVAIINITLPPEDVDVNIHPTKREVRFRQGRDIFVAVQRAVRRAILGTSPVRSSELPPAVNTANYQPLYHELDLRNRPGGSIPLGPNTQQAMEAYRPSAALGPQREGRLPMLRVVGQIAQTYIIAEGPGGMYLIDQHAAHERIRYEEIRTQKQGSLAAQDLLQPLPIDVAPQQAALLEEHLDDLVSLGFVVEPFGGSTFLVRRVPVEMIGESVTEALAEMLDPDAADSSWSWDDRAQITLACHTAIRAGQTLSMQEMQELVRKLEACEVPHTCPHGRPTLLHFSSAQLEKQFGRI